MVCGKRERRNVTERGEARKEEWNAGKVGEEERRQELQVEIDVCVYALEL